MDCEKQYPEGSVQWELIYGESLGQNISAFTASELSEMLPNRITIKEDEPFNSFFITMSKFILVDDKLNKVNNLIVNYECDSVNVVGPNAWLKMQLISNIYDHNWANALAKMLIYLLENGLIKND